MKNFKEKNVIKEMVDYNQKQAKVFSGRATTLFALIFFIILFGLAAFFTGCKSNQTPEEKAIEMAKKAEKEKVEIPNNFKLISKSGAEQFGFIYQYTCGNDTLYIVEGRSSAYPIAMSIKK